MTKTNSLKKALAGILAACMAATTLVAAPFTFGNSQNVGAASLDEMELLAQYSFESGYTDSVSGDTATATGTDAGAVTLQKEENGNTYLSIANESSFANNIKNYVEYDNPMKGVSSTNGFTIAMKIRLHDAALQTNSWEGLWCVANGVGPENAFAGMLPGGFRFNAGNNVFYDYTNEQHPELNPGISRRMRVIDGRTEHETVRRLCLFGERARGVVKDALSDLAAPAAGDAVLHGLCADLKDLRRDPLFFQRLCDLA